MTQKKIDNVSREQAYTAVYKLTKQIELMKGWAHGADPHLTSPSVFEEVCLTAVCSMEYDLKNLQWVLEEKERNFLCSA
tara:strand:+ start:4096 stop:4332 length:237 start_codon:yes stop_codon:yes gene_type:complete